MKNRSSFLRDAIEDLIATGCLRPGDHLDETELATRFGVSRTPIREALIQLASMGLVMIRPRRGAVVAEVAPEQLVEMFEVMAELEAMCGRLAARRMSSKDHAVLQSAHDACRDACAAGDADAYYYKNEQFHDAIYAGSHNTFLAEQARALHRRLRPYRRLQLRVRNRLPTSLGEHEAVVNAIRAGDGDLTADLLRQHVLVQGQRFADLIASLSQLATRAA
jgi:DNA-binding GntR family transcriptional regulator